MQILITGANRGIGAALAAKALEAGYQVIGTARNISGLDPAINWVELDVTSSSSLSSFSEAIAARPLDLVICNAGIYPDKGLSGIADYKAEIWQSAMQVNVIGVWQTIQAVLPNLRASRGKIAIISSIMASSSRAPGGSYAYRASKAAVTNLACNLATDLKPEGIAVGSFHPGWVRTDMGGDEADITLGESAEGLWERFAKLSLANTGVFESYNGEPIKF